MGEFERIFWIVLDSVGIGELPDAAEYGDLDRNTLGHIAESRPLEIPNLVHLGLANIAPLKHQTPAVAPIGAYGKGATRSQGKDTTTGHWEMAGVWLDQAFPVYKNGFPRDLIEEFEKQIGRKTIGNKPASGTEIIKELGEEHVRTSRPILYTSADSVFQVAAHQDVIPLEELYHICQIARDMLTGDNAVGRVIARPFTGTPGNFKRTEHRRDFSLAPLGITLLDVLKESGKEVIGIGKIEDLFAGRGLTQRDHTETNKDGMVATLRWLERDFTGLLFVNLVEFDMLWGHRRNSEGYAQALQDVDSWFAQVQQAMQPADAILFTADHGVDPTYRGSDHTREQVPLLAYGQPVRAGINLGMRSTFADLGQTLAQAFQVMPLSAGTSFAQEIGLV